VVVARQRAVVASPAVAEMCDDRRLRLSLVTHLAAVAGRCVTADGVRRRWSHISAAAAS